MYTRMTTITVGILFYTSCTPKFPEEELASYLENPDADYDGDGFTENTGDCDDANINVFPDANELCDGIDNDCNEIVDDNPVDILMWYADIDMDGFGDITDTITACTQPENYIFLDTEAEPDCDDNNANQYPHNTEICDGIDNNCDGFVDEDVLSLWYADMDNDGFGNSTDSLTACTQPENYILADGTTIYDCNDNNANQHPNNTEICDEIDNNCDGFVDEDLVLSWYADMDNDGFGDITDTIAACEQPENYILINSGEPDCNDTNANQYPNNTEVCDGIDNNCDGFVDENLLIPQFFDGDEDGFGDAVQRIDSCTLQNGYVENPEDCDDTDSNQYPGAAEYCNSEDDDCDGISDEGTNTDAPIDAGMWYSDFDGDGFGTESVYIRGCYAPLNFVANTGDCLDDNPNIYPNAPEICDNIDQNCDGLVDNNPIGGVTFYRDVDGDGDGELGTLDIIEACYILDAQTQAYLPPQGYADIGEDCDDADPNISSLADELCTLDIDENCDGSAVIAAIDPIEWYVDADGDGFGNPNYSIITCPNVDTNNNPLAPIGYSANLDDCDDLDGALFPGNTELCNGKLDDCNAAEDHNNDGIVEYTARSVEVDHDADGFIECPFIVSQWADYATLPLGSGDCQPYDDDVFPGAPELCTGEVEDCLSPDYGTVPDDEYDDDGDGYVECSGFIGVGWEGSLSVIGGNDCDDRAQDNNLDGVPDGFYTFPGAAEFYPSINNPDLNFCVADQNEDGLPDCVRMPTNTIQEAPADYYCEYGVFLDSQVGPDFVFIPQGTDPHNRYLLNHDFYMMTTEVTREMYEALTEETPSYYHNILFGSDYPVENITWPEAAHYANLLSDIAQLPRCYNENSGYAMFNQYSAVYNCPGYRLPTEAEWEYAARSYMGLAPQYLSASIWTPDGGGQITGNGANAYLNDGIANPSVGLYAWWAANNLPNGTKRVARLYPNGFGLYDMHGNIAEMTNDWSTSGAPGNLSSHVFPNNGILQNGLLVNPVGSGSGTVKVVRGGHFYSSNSYDIGVETPSGMFTTNTGKTNYIGFRLVRSDL